MHRSVPGAHPSPFDGQPAIANVATQAIKSRIT
jgi:hypothetical protein